MSPTATQTRSRPATPPSSGSRPDLRRQLGRRRSTRRRLLVAGMVLLVLALVAALLWLVGASSVLAAREVTVAGQRGLSAEQVRAAAAVPLGVPLARQDLDAIARRAASLPQVASVTAERRWPRTVALTVVEREPVLAVRQPGGYALVDAHGVAYQTLAAIPDGVLLTDADPGATELLTALGVVAAAMPPELADDVARLQATAADEITVDLASGTTVRWGDSRESALKAQIVQALSDKRTRTIDVSAPHTPSTR